MDALFTAGIAGLTAGGAYALLGVCAVLSYRLLAVVNFTGAATGTVGTFTMVALVEAGVPLPLAVVMGLLAGGVLGGLVGALMTTGFSDATPQNKAAVTVALLVGLIALGLRLTGGQHPHQFPVLLPGSAFRLAGVEVTNAALLTIGLAVLLTLASNAVLTGTRVGLLLRALSERPVAAELLGIQVRLLSLSVWAVSGAVTAFALMIIAPQRSPDFMSLSLLVVPAFAAALIGLFQNFWITVIGGVAVGIIEGLASNLTALSQYRGAVPFLVILAVLMWSQRGARYDEAR